MISLLTFLILLRVVVDLLQFYKPKPIWDVFYVAILLIGGVIFTAGHKPDLQPTPEGWILVLIGVVWGIFLFLKASGKLSKAKTDDRPRNTPEKPDISSSDE